MTRPRLPRVITIIVMACAVIGSAHAQNRIFTPPLWRFDFDGTDALLTGFSTKLGQSLFLRFDCSRQWVRFTIRTDELPDAGVGRVRLFLNDRLALSWQSHHGELIAATTRNAPQPAFVRDVFEMTAELYHSPDNRIRLVTSTGELEFRLPKGPAEFQHNDAIAKFRERCVTWWEHFL